MKSQQTNQDSIASYCADLAAQITKHTDGGNNGIHSTAIAQLEFLRDDASTTVCSIYKPAIAIIVQGSKEILLGEDTYRYGVGQFLIVSVELPVRAFIVEATPETPFLGFLLNLSTALLYEVDSQIQAAQPRPNPGMQLRSRAKACSLRGLTVGEIDLSLMDCALRLTRLLDTPQDIPFLAPAIVREIYYRLLASEYGEAIRQIATSGSNMQRISRLVKQIKTDFAQTLRIEILAEQANMSTSSFHRHFKAVTSMSPLQYQKQLRLLEARRLMLAEDSDATQAAYQVGYESPSQFSREYSRMFGAPPIQDIQRLRTDSSHTGH
ncbi:MAG: AraC family transcriptional regulator [Cyanobacteria bacterium P01_E01_bin.6]